MIPGISRNWRRTSCTTSAPARPTASIASEAKRYGMIPPIRSPTSTHGFEIEKATLTVLPASAAFVTSSCE